MAAPSPDDPLRTDDPEHLFSSLSHATGILAAVSGGPDSMALMHLLVRWGANPRPPILVATVDHGLRPEAAEEAAFVAREAGALGFPHRILAWTGEKPETGLQEAAREARYRLLVQQAREAGASHLVTAHTQDDQAETILMRLSKGSGLKGLAGMRRERDRDGILHVRPLLDCPKAALLDRCRRNGWGFVTDPSNADERFARVRWRGLMPHLAKEGLTADRLARLAERAAQAEEALDIKARQALEAAKPEAGQGVFAFQAACLAEEPFEISLRILEKALGRAGFENNRLQRLETCLERLKAAIGAGEALRLTIAGALLHLDRSGRLDIGPEPPRSRGR
ncbi:tRNA lysidine(34) synthetase TilS [Microvirga guangxiensis]|uniref:tRNA(Ile)-lysidine synthase n=1 Tax=Microvirga guangxiensis TaxID=549386 RepID=A0A1G5KTH1_9HYPH|nr:tRNA lysidine(34) synthetase TilS [Microvirga guangxiensis]SCZ03634.1 tRNA(Ile)-lysidine synthase [Microvirga guangxiensis]